MRESREAIEDQYKWVLTDIFESRSDLDSAASAVEDRIPELEAYAEGVVESPKTLREALELQEELARTVETIVEYARLKTAEDTCSSEAQAMRARSESVDVAFKSAMSSLKSKIQSLDDETLTRFLDEEPALRAYEHYFDDLRRQAPYTLSPTEESLLSGLDTVLEAPSEVYSTTVEADVTFPPVTRPDGTDTDLTVSNFATLMQHSDRSFRRGVYETFYETWGDYRHTIAKTLERTAATHAQQASVRGYESARSRALHKSNVPSTVYDTLVDTVRSNTEPLGEYTELLRRLFDLKNLRMWDIRLPLTGESLPALSYERAQSLLLEAVEPLGERYVSRLADRFESGCIDVYPYPNKRSGAFAGGAYDTSPYVLMNYQGDLSSAYTVAHELGHAMHSLLASESQPWQYAEPTSFVGEVAAIVNELLLTYHLLKSGDDSLATYALSQYLRQFRSTLYKQTLFAEFEHWVHRQAEAGEALTPDVLNSRYLELKRAYYDHQNTTVDEYSAREWMRVPHFHMNFYVYKYAVGFAAAVAIVNRIRNESEDTVDDYLAALAAGKSTYPVDTLSIAGVDVTDSGYVEDAVSTFDDLTTRADRRLR